jgi:hypothetical protein
MAILQPQELNRIKRFTETHLYLNSTVPAATGGQAAHITIW